MIPLSLSLLLIGCRDESNVVEQQQQSDPNRTRLLPAHQAIDDSIAAGKIPGAVLLLGQDDAIAHLHAFGQRSLRPAEPMTADTIFDMASLTKPVACATSIMILADRGKLSLDDPVAKYIPAFAANGKENITIADLLLHRAGLIPDNSIKDYENGPAAALAAVYSLKPLKTPGQHFWYSDVGYIVLGEIVRSVDGRALDRFSREEIFLPLRMNDTMYLPSDALKLRCAPTEQREGRWMRGEVHDPRAYALGGVAGHAGLFSTAHDLSRYCRMLINGGELDGKRILSAATVREMTSSRALADGNSRTYGFDVNTAYSSTRGERFDAGTTFGHTGFTGTMFWIDPLSRSYVILLTNRVHPDGKGEVGELRKRIATIAAETMLGAKTDGRRPAVGAPTEVLCGIDVLIRDGFKQLAGRNIALVTNHTGRDREGARTIDLLHGAKNLKLVCLLSPEHGLYGQLDEKVGHAVDQKTGLKVWSLYGDTRRPNPEMLEGVDTIVFDIQDIGTRFYTYPATMGNCMEEAAKRRLRVVILDRPNPITGLIVDGPLAEEQTLGFTSYAPIPLVHGMTVGELARMFNVERKINCDLQVIAADGWRRSMWFDETGLTWTNPSPNMRNTTQALLYPAVGLIEAANISVGRGTDQPFELLGAPWIDNRRLAATLNAARLPGVRFVPIEFTPTSSKFKDQPCKGVYVIVTDRDRFEPARTAMTIAWWLKTQYGTVFEWDKAGRLLHSPRILKALEQATDPAAVALEWKSELEAFRAVRKKYLLYQ